jgi:methylmalonyl-CoA carboxyltransferase large subunit
MESATVDWAELSAALGALRKELSRLSERVAALEAAIGGTASTTSWSPPPALTQSPVTCAQPVPPAEGLSEELLLVISAAIAAFLGKRPHIRQIRLLGTAAWAQQGRVTIQASHDLAGRHR